MSDIEWKDCNGVPVAPERRDEWAAHLAKMARDSKAERDATDEDWHNTSSMSSGDSFVWCMLNFDGSIELRDCLVRRRALIPAPEIV